MIFVVEIVNQELWEFWLDWITNYECIVLAYVKYHISVLAI